MGRSVFQEGARVLSDAAPGEPGLAELAAIANVTAAAYDEAAVVTEPPRPDICRNGKALQPAQDRRIT